MIAGVVLAAGAGTRFGGCKQLAQLAGRPLLEHALAAMGSAPVADRIVVLGGEAEAILAAVDLHGARPVLCGRWAEGQSASLRAGIDAAPPGTEAVVVTLGDQPRISSRAIAAVVAARGGGAQAARATYAGTPGHPVLIERELFGAVRALTGDVGARAVLRGARVRDVPCDGLGDPGDVDTRDQLPS